jgi:putative adhesin
MSTFETPRPIAATIDLGLGDVRISAGERADTTVTVEPNDASNDEDRKAAEQTRVEYAHGRLLVKAPKLRSWLPHRTGGSIAVAIELPAGSDVHASGGVADIRCDGPLGNCVIKTGVGRIQVDAAQALTVKSGAGDVSVDRVIGHAEVSLGSGDVRLRELDSTAVVKNSSGDAWIGMVAGDLRISGASVDIAVDVAQSTVTAKTAQGDVRVGEIVRGSAVLETQVGDVEIGIREGTAAWLDVRASTGNVHNTLDAADEPGAAADTVEVRARTTVGDVVIRRP